MTKRKKDLPSGGSFVSFRNMEVVQVVNVQDSHVARNPLSRHHFGPRFTVNRPLTVRQTDESTHWVERPRGVYKQGCRPHVNRPPCLGMVRWASKLQTHPSLRSQCQ